MNDGTDDLPLLRPLRLPRGVPKEVTALFEKLSLEVADRGFRRYSSRAILHQVRWHTQIEQGQRLFRVNNRWSRPLSDWFMEKHPNLGQFFETRDRQAKGGDDE